MPSAIYRFGHACSRFMEHARLPLAHDLARGGIVDAEGRLLSQSSADTEFFWRAVVRLLNALAPAIEENQQQISALRTQVTSLQEHNTAEVKSRRKAEAVRDEFAERLRSYTNLDVKRDAECAQQGRLECLCKLALGKWGEELQLGVCAEECAELGAEILRVLRGRKDHREAMIEEAADVYITVMQLRLLASDIFEQKLAEKMNRLELLLAGEDMEIWSPKCLKCARRPCRAYMECTHSLKTGPSTFLTSFFEPKSDSEASA